MMEIYWHTKKEHIDHLRGEVVFDLDNDYLLPVETDSQPQIFII